MLLTLFFASTTLYLYLLLVDFLSQLMLNVFVLLFLYNQQMVYSAVLYQTYSIVKYSYQECLYIFLFVLDCVRRDYIHNTHIKLLDQDLTSSSFADSHLTGVKFEACDLTSVDFTRANLVECSFDGSILNGTDFSYSKADYCNFSEADLAGSVFQGADLSNSDLSSAENLSACRFDEETVWPDNEYLPEDFDTKYSSDLSSLQDDDDYQQSDY